MYTVGKVFVLSLGIVALSATIASHAPAARLSVRSAVSSASCQHDVDGNGVVDVATDVVYIARHLLGLSPVPPSFRTQDPTIPAQGQGVKS
jgi:hypothetical protein